MPRKSVWAALLVWILASPAVLAQTGDAGYVGRSLVDVLQELHDEHGLELIFSSAVIGDEILVTTEPSSPDPRVILDEILLPLGLKAEDGPAGAIMIVPAGSEFGRLQGRVVSLILGRPVEGAVVRLLESDRSTISHDDGSFELSRVPAGRHAVRVEARGFLPAIFSRIRVGAGATVELKVELRAHPSFVTEVVVTPNRHSLVREEQAARHTVTSEEAVLVPTIGGDISRAVELLPGVSAPDNSAAFNVRGSVARDVSLVLDGLELYDPFHLQGFQSPFSLIDSNVVDRIDFFGGGFTADFGDRHGGFVEISTFEAGSAPRGEIEIGTLNSRVSYGSPMLGGTGAWLVSARGWYPQFFQQTIELGAGEQFDSARFADLYAKAAFSVSPKHILSVHGLVSSDRLAFTEIDEEDSEIVDSRSKNGYIWLRALSAWSSNVTSKTLLSGGQIERLRAGSAVPDEGQITIDDSRKVDFFGLRHDSVWQINGAHALKVGADVRWLSSEYVYSRIHEEDPKASTEVTLDPDGTSLGIYLAHRARVTEKLATEVGLRWDRQTYTDDNQVSPRFNALWRTGARSEVRLALGRFHQSQRIHELNVQDGETQYHRAEVSEQAEISFQHGFESGLSIRCDAYYRKLTNLRPRYENLFEPVELFPETALDRVMIAPDEARLRGIELLVRGDVNRPLFWWVSYSLSAAEDVIDGQYVLRSWDQTHAGKFLIGYRRDERWSVSMSGRLHTGWPTTPATAGFDDEGEIVPVLDMRKRNTKRFSTYVRVDLKARRSYSLPHGRLWLTLEIVNLTDRKNPCCVDEFSFDPPEEGTPGIPVTDHWLRLNPYASIAWEF